MLLAAQLDPYVVLLALEKQRRLDFEAQRAGDLLDSIRHRKTCQGGGLLSRGAHKLPRGSALVVFGGACPFRNHAAEVHDQPIGLQDGKRGRRSGLVEQIDSPFQFGIYKPKLFFGLHGLLIGLCDLGPKEKIHLL